jgi:hypothetical protein
MHGSRLEGYVSDGLSTILDLHQYQVWASILEKDASRGLRDAARTKNSGMSRQQRRRAETNRKKQSHDLEHCRLSSIPKGADKFVGGLQRGTGNTGTLLSKIGGTNHSPAAVMDDHDAAAMRKWPALTLHVSNQAGVVAPESNLPSDGIGRSAKSIRDAFEKDPVSSFYEDADHQSRCIMMEEGQEFPPTIYSRVQLENNSHPFFKRVWTLRHKLDENSPLLDKDAVSILQRFHAEGGVGFPVELNSYAKLREHVKFQEISVTLNGTDHITGHPVYGNTSYTSLDLVIGYRFANALVGNPRTNEVRVDVSLLNDVLEQHGGGGEPLFEEAKLEPPLAIADVAADIENQLADPDDEDLTWSHL